MVSMGSSLAREMGREVDRAVLLDRWELSDLSLLSLLSLPLPLPQLPLLTPVPPVGRDVD